MEALALFDADLEPLAVAPALPARPKLSPQPPGRPRGPCLLAVDGNALAHRAFHAYSAVDGPGPVYGFLALLCAICDRVGPSAVAVAFDCPQWSVRKERYAGYKANRPDKDPALHALLGGLLAILRDLGVYVGSVPGWEADDVLGSAATAAEAVGWRCVVATSDRDAYGLISDATTVLRLRSGMDNAVEVTRHRLLREVGVRPEQYVQFAALRGDPSDNLPGIRGIGRRRATALLSAYPTVEAACADPIGCRSVLGPVLGQVLLDDVSAQASVFRRNVELMTIRRDLSFDVSCCHRTATAEELAQRLAAHRLPGLAGRVAAALAARPQPPPPPGDDDAPPR